MSELNRLSSIRCDRKDSITNNLTVSAGRKKYTDENLWESECRKFIGGATAMVFDLIMESRSQV